MKVIKQYGLRRCGTNYLRWLVEHNFKDVIFLENQGGWKHGPVQTKLDLMGTTWNDPVVHNEAKIKEWTEALGENLELIQKAFEYVIKE